MESSRGEVGEVGEGAQSAAAAPHSPRHNSNLLTTTPAPNSRRRRRRGGEGWAERIAQFFEVQEGSKEVERQVEGGGEAGVDTDMSVFQDVYGTEEAAALRDGYGSRRA